MQTTDRKSEIERLERAFWQSLVDGDPGVASGMLTDTASMASSHGAFSFDPATYEKMASDPKHRVLDFSFSDFAVLFPRDDVAVATYRAWQKYQREGEVIEEDVVDTSTWVRIGGEWKCAAHTESPAATPPPPAR
jgi:hypothetical protein